MQAKRESISVIVITYNQEQYICDCINSIISQQTSANIDVLIGDDASSDGTGKILDGYAQKYSGNIQVFHRGENIGASANIKDLIDRAKGKYIAFCEGDDFWIDEKKLEKQIIFLKKHTNLVGCTHGVFLANENGVLWNKMLQHIHPKPIFSLSDFDLSAFPGHLSSLMLRNNEEWKNLDKSIILCDRNRSDMMIFFLALSIGKLGYIHQYMGAYRYIRNSSGNNLLAQIYQNKLSECAVHMKICTAMEAWLLSKPQLKKSFVSTESRILATALFQKIKGYNVSLIEVWSLCKHPLLALMRFPVSLWEQAIKKIQVWLGLKVR